MIKTFRGILADGAQDTIRLSTKQGKIGYRIVKFNIFPNLPGTSDVESTLQVFKVKQSSVSTTQALVDFADGALIAVAYMAEGSGADQGPLVSHVVFDQEIFNQNIYVTHTDTAGSRLANYYLELEVMSLNDNEATVSTLMDIRGSS